MRINSFVPSEKVFEKNFGTSEVKNEDKKVSFTDMLKDSLDNINNQQIQSDNVTDAFVRGDDNTSIEDVMLTQSEAKLSLQFAVQVRNKLLEGYKEIIKMQM